MIRAILTVVVSMAIAAGQAPLVPGQPDRENRYMAIHTQTGNGEGITVQQPSTAAASVQFEIATVFCAAACTATISQNGTAATSTTLATKGLNNAPASQATAWSASNVGTGTALNTYNIAAGATLTLDLSKFYLNRGIGTAANLTITTAGTAANPQTMIQWAEK